MLFEHTFHCPYCDAPISVVLDLSEEYQSYIEDCEVCCQAMQLNVTVENTELSEFRASRLDD